MTVALALVEDEPPITESQTELMGQLTHTWQAIETKKQADLEALKKQQQADLDALKVNKEAVFVTADMSKGETLATYEGLGLSQKQLALATGIDCKSTSRYLRFARFNTFLVDNNIMATRIKQRRFRQLWSQHSDEPTLRSLQGASHIGELRTHEAKIFGNIVQVLLENANAFHPNGRKKKEKKQPDIFDAVATTKQQKKKVEALRGEIQGIYGRMKHDIDRMKSIANAERARLDPAWIAEHATRLEKGFMDLQKALKRDIGSLKV